MLKLAAYFSKIGRAKLWRTRHPTYQRTEIRACLFHRGNKALMLVVHIIGFASIWSIFQRSFFLQPLASFYLVQNNGRLPLRVMMAISTAAIPPERQERPFRNRQWLKALAATAMGRSIGGGVLVYCNRSRSCAPSSFAEAFCIVMGASSILSLYLWSVELIRYAYQTSFSWAVFLLLPFSLHGRRQRLWETRRLALCRILFSLAPPR